MSDTSTSSKSVRVQKVEKELREIISQVLPELVYFEGGGVMLTVMRVEVASDLRSARVFVSVFPDDAAEDVMEELETVRSDVQAQVSKKLRMKYLPRIKWINDHSVDQLVKVSEILKQDKSKTSKE